MTVRFVLPTSRCPPPPLGCLLQLTHGLISTEAFPDAKSTAQSTSIVPGQQLKAGGKI